jgi:hypothetical protein
VQGGTVPSHTKQKRFGHADLAASQFPNPIVLGNGTELYKPTGW